ncbi:MAG: HDOD domain-containing protein [Betaproteobacteria bacterium]
MERQSFDELKTTGKLPSPAGVALRIMELCRQDEVTLTEIAHVVQVDPALSGRLVKFANSATTGPRRPVTAIVDAIRLLGVNTVRQLALGFSVLGQHRTGACNAFDYHGFWARSLASAITANALCMRTRTAAPDEAFACALMARVGSLALATLYPDTYGPLVAAAPDAESLLRLEREQFRTDHLEMTAALLEEWRLPPVFVRAIAHHEDPTAAHYPDGSREAALCLVFHLATRIGLFCGSSDDGRKAMLMDLVLEGARLGLEAEALGVLVDQVVAEWHAWGRLLDVATEDVPPFATLAAAAASEAPSAVARETMPPIVVGTIGTPPEPVDLPGAESPAAAPASASATSAGAPAEVEALRILVVDDDSTVLKVVSRLLAQEGYSVGTAHDGRDALRLAVSGKPQMIVCDWLMPGMDGLSLCRSLRATDEGKRIYFLLLTSNEEEDRLVEAFEAGVDDFITKPVSRRVLTARLRAGLRVIRMQQEIERDSQSLRRFATELALANRRLRQAALTDPLTALPNRRYAMERLDQEWSASLRNRRTFSVMMVDIDRFKAVNDAHGHEAGDQVLRQVAITLRKAARSEDVICRLGGEEFLVISPDTQLAPVMRLAERLRQAICAVPMMVGALHYPLSVSIGVAERLPSMVHFDELLKAADVVLYRAKRAGGNCVQAAGLPVSSAQGLEPVPVPSSSGKT